MSAELEKLWHEVIIVRALRDLRFSQLNAAENRAKYGGVNIPRGRGTFDEVMYQPVVKYTKSVWAMQKWICCGDATLCKITLYTCAWLSDYTGRGAVRTTSGWPDADRSTTTDQQSSTPSCQCTPPSCPGARVNGTSCVINPIITSHTPCEVKFKHAPVLILHYQRANCVCTSVT